MDEPQSGSSSLPRGTRRSGGTGAWRIEPLVERYWDAVLRLSVANFPEVWGLERSELARLLAFGGYHVVAVDESAQVLGYVLSYPRSCDYDDAEIRAFRQLIDKPFVYICQVAIASEHRGCGIGRALYDAIGAWANGVGARILCCDVNLDPPNPHSVAFHRRLGFVQIGQGRASNGFAIALLVKTW